MSGVSEREKQNDGVSEREKQKVKKMEIRRKVRSRSVNTILRSKSAKNTIFLFESPVTFCQVRLCGQNMSKIRFFFQFPQCPGDTFHCYRKSTTFLKTGKKTNEPGLKMKMF